MEPVSPSLADAGSADLASPPCSSPYRAGWMRTTLRRSTRDECDVHDIMYSFPGTPKHGTALYRFSDFALSDILLSSRTFSFDTCFLLCLVFFSEAFFSYVCCFSITQRPGQVFSYDYKHLWEVCMSGILRKDKVQPHGYVAGTHTRLVFCLMSYLDGCTSLH